MKAMQGEKTIASRIETGLVSSRTIRGYQYVCDYSDACAGDDRLDLGDVAVDVCHPHSGHAEGRHQQPTVFYALVVYCHLVGLADPLMIGLAWGYVALRVLHSLIQALWNFIPVRFLVFISSTIVLIVMSVRAVLALL